MLFPTTVFAIFFALVFWASWSLSGRLEVRKYVLLGASYVFYGYWDWRFLSLLAISSAINYVAGHLIAHSDDDGRRRTLVVVAVTLNLVILGFFKYFGFFVESAVQALSFAGLERDIPLFEIILPIGVSFFTFQGISYVVDIYRRDIKAVKSPVDLFLYISFFPQLVAGPIIRASDFLPQLDQRPRLSLDTVSFALLLICVGLFKKVVVASYLASEFVDDVFAVPEAYSSADLYFAAHAFAVQIYCDFSGYSDIAIGVAALLGFHFKKNFDRPLAASSLQELWQRWHISLTSWLRDYLYKPLKGSKRGTGHMYRNLIATMTIAGLWHGAAWTFVIWGAIQGVVLVAERWINTTVRQTRRAFETGQRPDLVGVGLMRLSDAVSVIPLFGWFVTLNIFAIAGVFFRSETLDAALSYFNGLAQFTLAIDAFTPFVALLVFGSIAVQFLPADWLKRRADQFEGFGPMAAGVSLGFALVVIEWIGPDGVAPFIYFQF